MRRAGIRRTGQKLVAFLLVVLLVFPMMVPAQAKAATTLMGRASASDVVEATAENKKGIQGVEFWTGCKWSHGATGPFPLRQWKGFRVCKC